MSKTKINVMRYIIDFFKRVIEFLTRGCRMKEQINTTGYSQVDITRAQRRYLSKMARKYSGTRRYTKAPAY